jgi:cyclic-di-GMP-binding protein
MITESPIRLAVPEQDLETLSLFPTRADAAQDWTNRLPVANPQVVAQQLETALGEINRCRMGPEQRFEILGALQGNLHIACSSLSRRFLNQPLIMPDEPRRLAELIDSIYTHAISAYTCTALEALKQRDSIQGMNPARLVCEALLKALEFCNRKFLLCFQLHQPVEINGWLTLHQLYALGERQELANIPLPATDGGETSIRATYLVALTLGCCKPNQLRQADLAAVYRALQLWSNFLTLGSCDNGEGLFLVDLDRDQPPLYSALYRDNEAPQCRQIDTSALVNHMQNMLAANSDRGRAGIPLEDDTQIEPGLLSHMIDSLGTMSVRNFKRKAVEGALKVSTGLSAAHYHAARDHDFMELLHGNDYIPDPADRIGTNPFGESSPVRDIWSAANPEEDYQRSEDGGEAEANLSHQVQLPPQAATAILGDGAAMPAKRSFPVYEAKMINASPGGYCLEWSERLPPDVKVGELMSVQEEDNGHWVIAVIRWISQLEKRRTLMGLALLSPKAKAYGAVTRQKTGEESEPQRVLLLPEIKLVGQPNTLITSRAGFRENQKVTLLAHGEKLHVQLLRQILASGGFAQFEFRYIRLLDEVIAEDKSGPLDASYDSLWSNI